MPDLSRRGLFAAAFLPQGEPPASLGNLYPPIAAHARLHQPPKMSFLQPKFRHLGKWKQQARAVYAARLAYAPARVPFDARVEGREEKDGYTQERLTFRTAAESVVSAVFLKPARPLPSRPALVALHDHGGFYYFGKEKILDNTPELPLLADFKKRIYGGRSFASDFARAGFHVLAIDAFYFGSRRLDPASVRSSPLPAANGSAEYIAAYNKWAGSYESLMAKTIFLSGSTWPGMILWDDLRSVDYLASRAEVNPQRIGCVGLSGGGLRAATLCGMHPAIRSTVVCCFMSTAAGMLRGDVEHHTWMMYVPHVFGELDLPDVASMTAPNHLLVQYGTRDALFDNAGQRESAAKLTAVFRKAGCAERFRGSFHDAPHSFDAAMQEEALGWFRESLA